MRNFINRYSGISLAVFLFQVVGAFIIGALSQSRWTPESGLAKDEVPSVLIGGFAAVLIVALYLTFAWMLRVVGYIRYERYAPVNPTWWRNILIFEGLYAVFNLVILWIAAEPSKDGNFALVFLMLGAAAVSVYSVIFVIVAFLKTRRSRADDLKED